MSLLFASCTHMLQALGQVNAHINSLRSLLNSSSGKIFHGADQLDTSGCIKNGIHLRHGVSDSEKVGFKSASPLESFSQNQSNIHIPTGFEKEEGLTEEESMRLDRLLRAVKALPKNPKQKAEEGALTVNRGDQNTDHEDRGDRATKGRNDAGGSESETAREHHFAAEDTSFDREQTHQNPSNISSTPEVGDRSARDVLAYENVADLECSAYSGRGLQGDISTLCMQKEGGDDDLEDISDGGFHSGCWRRKYASGEIR